MGKGLLARYSGNNNKKIIWGLRTLSWHLAVPDKQVGKKCAGHYKLLQLLLLRVLYSQFQLFYLLFCHTSKFTLYSILIEQLIPWTIHVLSLYLCSCCNFDSQWMPCLLDMSAEFLLNLEINSTDFYYIKHFHIPSLKCPLNVIPLCQITPRTFVHAYIIRNKWVIDMGIQISFNLW